MLSDSWKSGFKMASENPKKKIAKNYKICLAISEALTIHPTNFLRPLFDSKFFLRFKFYFSHKTPRGLKTWEN